MNKPKHWKLPSHHHGVVLFNANDKYYLTFSSVTSMYFWYKQAPKPLHYNEVIRKEVPRKFFLDIDDEPDIGRIQDCVSSLFGADNIIMFSTSPQRYHIVINNFHTTSHHTCKIIAKYIADVTQVSSIDMGCYASVKCLRLEGSCKKENGYIKYNISDSDTFLDGLITHITNNSKELSSTIPVIPKRITSIVTAFDDTVFRKRAVEGSITFFDRIRPSYCLQCKRVHNSENVFMIGHRFMCWRYYHAIQ